MQPTPAEGCRIRLDSCISSIERHLSKVLVAFFSPFLEALPLGESPPAAYRPRMHGTCKKNGRSAFGCLLRNRKTNSGYQEITETRMKGRLCDAPVTEFERQSRRHPRSSPRAQVTRKLPGSGDTTRDVRRFVRFTTVSSFPFFPRTRPD